MAAGRAFPFHIAWRADLKVAAADRPIADGPMVDGPTVDGPDDPFGHWLQECPRKELQRCDVPVTLGSCPNRS